MGRRPAEALAMVRWWLLWFLLLATTSAWSRPQTPGLREHTFTQNGIERQYLLYTPRGVHRLKGKRPLVLVIHGGSGTHTGMVDFTRRRFNRLADQHGFYVAFPNAVDKMWNFGKGQISASLKRKVDDRAYFEKLLDDLDSRLPIDPRRVFATGISRGGQACYYLAGQFPHRIRAIAPVTMPLPTYLADECRQGPPIGLAVFNGTGDPAVPYRGGWIELFGKKRDQVLSTEETLKIWLQRNGCPNLEPESQRTIDKPGDQTSVTRIQYSCAQAPVVLYRIENGGHTWPGGGQYLPKKLIGEVCHDIDGATEIWDFFSQFK